MATSRSAMAILLLFAAALLTAPAFAARPCATTLLLISSSTTSSTSLSVFRFRRIIYSDANPDPYPPQTLAHHHHQPASYLGLGSFQARAQDVLAVLAGLLFGVGCGALAAAALHLFRSALTEWRSGNAYEEEEEELGESPKKGVVLGYVRIPDDAHEMAAAKKLGLGES